MDWGEEDSTVIDCLGSVLCYMMVTYQIAVRFVIQDSSFPLSLLIHLALFFLLCLLDHYISFKTVLFFSLPCLDQQ